MEKWRSAGKKFFILPLWLICILVLVSAGALIYVFTESKERQWLAYAVYVLSFYTLTVVVVACVTTIPSYYKSVKQKVFANPYANRYLTDVVYKMQINLYVSLGINFLYVIINAVSAIVYQTCWFAIFAIYYGIMAVMRLLLLRSVGKTAIGKSRLEEFKCARVCAYVLLTINLTLSAVVLMMVYYDRGFSYRGYLIYVMALYTFYITVSALIDCMKYRKYHSAVLSVSKMVQLTASLFSMLFLETAMFAQFGENTSAKTKRIMIMATGAGICAAVVGMSVVMIVRSSKEIRKYKARLLFTVKHISFCDFRARSQKKSQKDIW